MDADTILSLKEYLLGLADDELVLGHRDSEWCGHAPILEEDIAFANIALDEIGHAAIWYVLVAELAGADPETYPDQLVYFRQPQDYRCIQMVELPPGDFAFSMLRQYLFDAAEKVRLDFLAGSSYPAIAEVAAKIRNEEIYHYRHTTAWVRRLGLGTEDSHSRLQNALDELWPYAGQMFEPAYEEDRLVGQGLVPPTQQIRESWTDLVIPLFTECQFQAPDDGQMISGTEGRDRHSHTPYLQSLLAEMQTLPRLEPTAKW